MTADRKSRIASAALVVVLLLLTGFSIWVSVTNYTTAQSVTQSTRLSDTYSRALYAVGQEKSLDRAYQLGPSSLIRAQHAAAASAFDAAMNTIHEHGTPTDRVLVDTLKTQQAVYLDAMLRMFDAVDAGNTARATTIDITEADPVFGAIEHVVSAAGDAHHEQASQQLTALRQRVFLLLIATPVVLALRIGVLGVIWSIFRAFRRSISHRELRFRALVQHSSDVISIVDAAGHRLYVSPSVEHVFGYRPADLVGERAAAVWHPDDAAACRAFYADLRTRPGDHATMTCRIRLADGSWRWAEVVATNLLAEPAIGGFVVNVRDITDRKAAEHDLIQERDLLHLLMDSLPDQIFFKDSDSRFVRINRAGADILGLSDPSEAVGKSDVDFAPPELAATYVADDRRVMTARKPIRDLVESFVGAEGVTHWVSTSKAPIFDLEGNVTGVVGISRDVTERRKLEEQLAHQAFHDALTNLPNRMLFADRLAHALERSAREAAALAVLFVDLDGFKVVNDSFGHDLGDALLLTVAGRLSASVRAGDTVARLGGDEFIVLLEAAEAIDAEETAQRILQRLVAPISLDGRPVVISASIGIACKTSPIDSAEDLLKRADVAMYIAKQRGKSQFSRYDDAMQSEAGERRVLEAELRNAMVSGEFRVFYQPIVDLATSCATSVEALVRWEHPVRGLMSPGEFIPLAEETGLILPIGWWVLNEACRQTRRWQIEHPQTPPLSVSVNLSPRMFQDPNLVSEVERILNETGLDPVSLKLEITEGVMIQDGDAGISVLRRLRGLGVRLAIDDFGTGYSSLTYLQRLPVDVLKIDRSFVARMGRDAESLEIVRLIVGLARTIGLAVVGEGIETEEQRRALRELGVEQGQGFLFALPLSADDAEVVLSQHARQAFQHLVAVGD